MSIHTVEVYLFQIGIEVTLDPLIVQATYDNALVKEGEIVLNKLVLDFRQRAFLCKWFKLRDE